MTQPGTWTPSRRVLLGSPLLLATPVRSAPPSLADDVRTFVDFGEHRAGTRGEFRTAEWLKRRLQRLGYATERQSFPIETLINPGGHIECAKQQTALFPQWLPPRSALNQNAAAPLLDWAAPAGSASIRLLTEPAKLTANWSDVLTEQVRAAEAKGALAVLLTLDDPADDLFVCNQHHPGSFPIPVMLFAKRELPQLKSKLGMPAKLRVQGHFQKTRAYNIVGQKPGVGRQLVVSTPLTGWFRCGGERGPGIALWLRMAAALATQKRPVLMLGTGSHEIGHLGMEYALRHGTSLPDQVGLWLHFGASIAATRLNEKYRYKSGQYLVGTESSKNLAMHYLADTMPIYVPGSEKTLGESGQVIGAGHTNFIGMSGQFPTFHTPLDRGEAIDFAHLEKIAAASERLLRELP